MDEENEIPGQEEEPQITPETDMLTGEFTRTKLAEYAKLSCPTARFEYLCEILQVAHYKTNPRSRLWVDFCFNHVEFAMNRLKLPHNATLIYIKMLQQVFEHATTPSPEWATVESTYALFAQVIKEHGVQDENQLEPQFTFAMEQIETIVNFVSTSFFRHYKAYQYAYRYRPTVKTRRVPLCIDLPFAIPPLQEAVADQLKA